MYEDKSGEDESRRQRRVQGSRASTPRAMRPTRHRKKTAGGSFGGVHRRRNKHWSW
jgi:hypothetical protein